jgi:DNA-directed RNA polymerase specialized sigma24 family protein
MLHRVVAADAFSTERRYLWDLCYRATGSAADADMLLRDSFARAVEHPLARDADWRLHLTRSAAILAMDALRRRKRRKYIGCWLPSPCETGAAVSRAPRPSTSSHGPRYDAVESGSMAFLVALEALAPRERVMLLMCDAFGVEPYEAAAAIELTSPTAKAALQQARRKMQPYDAAHEAPTADVQAHTAEVLRHCLSHLQNHDAGRLEKMLAPDARLCFDGGGEFVAPHAPEAEPARIARILLKFAKGADPIHFGFRMLNGMPAALGTSPGRARWARLFVFRIETRDSLVTDVQAIMASAKLTAVRFDPS